MNNQESFGQALKFKLVELGVSNNNLSQGCTEKQIETFMSDQDVSYLPHTYLEFLRYTGKSMGGFLAGTDLFCDQLLGIKGAAIHLLLENKVEFSLPENSFVFLMHEGYQFMYFLCEENSNDPEVYYYLETDEYPIKKWDRLSQMLTMFILEKEGEDAYQEFLSKYT